MNTLLEDQTIINCLVFLHLLILQHHRWWF